MTFTLRLPPEQLAALRALAAARNTNVGEEIRQAIAAHLSGSQPTDLYLRAVALAGAAAALVGDLDGIAHAGDPCRA